MKDKDIVSYDFSSDAHHVETPLASYIMLITAVGRKTYCPIKHFIWQEYGETTRLTEGILKIP